MDINGVCEIAENNLNFTAKLAGMVRMKDWDLTIPLIVIDVILNFTNPFRIGAIVIAQAAYKIMKKVGAAAIKAILTSFMGPLA